MGSIGLDSDVLNAFAGNESKAASAQRVVERMERNEFDLIAVGRALLGDPHWASKIQSGGHANLKGFDAAAPGALVRCNRDAARRPQLTRLHIAAGTFFRAAIEHPSTHPFLSTSQTRDMA
ncbi:hypothetical protein [Variovorax sp. E3]|uniref:hypothetical protein n=1 Tax=Variovorax sp. E3 TaxID=1914993 RepID=UPI0018DC46CC|nr:hypothetical protein [Variovorax sp. E3]